MSSIGFITATGSTTPAATYEGYTVGAATMEIAIASLAAQAGSNQSTLRVGNATTVSSNLQIPATMQLVLEGGGLITVGGGSTLTILGAIQDPGLRRIFAGAGTVKVNQLATPYVRPEWWGARADSTTAVQGTACDAAFQAAINSLPFAGGVDIRLSGGGYAFLTGIAANMTGDQATSQKCFRFVGVGPYLNQDGATATSLIWWGSSAATPMLTLYTREVTCKGIIFDCGQGKTLLSCIDWDRYGDPTAPAAGGPANPRWLTLEQCSFGTAANDPGTVATPTSPAPGRIIYGVRCGPKLKASNLDFFHARGCAFWYMMPTGVPQGVWDCNRTYAVNDLSWYGGTMYRCIVTVSPSVPATSTPTPAADTTHWRSEAQTGSAQGVWNFSGGVSTTLTYSAGDVVFYNNLLYVMIGAGPLTSTTPPDTDTANWAPTGYTGVGVYVASTTGQAKSFIAEDCYFNGKAPDGAQRYNAMQLAWWHQSGNFAWYETKAYALPMIVRMQSATDSIEIRKIDTENCLQFFYIAGGTSPNPIHISGRQAIANMNTNPVAGGEWVVCNTGPLTVSDSDYNWAPPGGTNNGNIVHPIPLVRMGNSASGEGSAKFEGCSFIGFTPFQTNGISASLIVDNSRTKQGNGLAGYGFVNRYGRGSSAGTNGGPIFQGPVHVRPFTGTASPALPTPIAPMIVPIDFVAVGGSTDAGGPPAQQYEYTLTRTFGGTEYSTGLYSSVTTTFARDINISMSPLVHPSDTKWTLYRRNAGAGSYRKIADILPGLHVFVDTVADNTAGTVLPAASGPELGVYHYAVEAVTPLGTSLPSAVQTYQSFLQGVLGVQVPAALHNATFNVCRTKLGPLTGCAVAQGGAGSVDAGLHNYAVAYYDPGFGGTITDISPIASITLADSAHAVSITGIPTSGSLGRYVVRQKAGVSGVSSSWFIVADLHTDSTTTTATDSASDASLTGTVKLTSTLFRIGTVDPASNLKTWISGAPTAPITTASTYDTLWTGVWEDTIADASLPYGTAQATGAGTTIESLSVLGGIRCDNLTTTGTLSFASVGVSGDLTLGEFIKSNPPAKGSGTATGQVSAVIGAGAGTTGSFSVDANANYMAGRISITPGGTGITAGAVLATVTLHGGRSKVPIAILPGFSSTTNSAPSGSPNIRNIALSGSDVTFEIWATGPSSGVLTTYTYVVIDQA